MTSAVVAPVQAGYVRVLDTFTVTLDASNPVFVTRDVDPPGYSSVPAVPLHGSWVIGVAGEGGFSLDEHQVSIIANGPLDGTEPALVGRYTYKFRFEADPTEPTLTITTTTTYVNFA